VLNIERTPRLNCRNIIYIFEGIVHNKGRFPPSITPGQKEPASSATLSPPPTSPINIFVFEVTLKIFYVVIVFFDVILILAFTNFILFCATFFSV
jgi:hypothetical protein